MLRPRSHFLACCCLAACAMVLPGAVRGNVNSDPRHYLARGDELARAERWRDAIAHYTLALQLDPRLGDAYALVKAGEIFLFGAQITPLSQASTHVVADDRRTRKLLMHRHEIDKLVGKVERDGYTLIPTAVYWKGNKVKLEIALAKGKQSHDKRQASKDRDWQREKERTMRRHNKNA